MRVYLIDSPLSIPISKVKKFPLNLNQYRNAHFHVLNKAKVEYKALMAPLINELPVMERIHVTYTVYAPTRRLFDIGNICSVVDKFFLDALTELGKIEDDNYKFIPQVTYQFGKIDAANPRVEIRITDFTNANISLD